MGPSADIGRVWRRRNIPQCDSPAIVSSVFVGYGAAGSGVRSRVHSLAFALVLAVVLYVIVDLEFPRLGLIRVDSMDQMLVEMRESMD